MNINSNLIALLELGFAAVAYSGAQNETGLVKAGLYATTGYMLLGAYLNAQGRVKVT